MIGLRGNWWCFEDKQVEVIWSCGEDVCSDSIIMVTTLDCRPEGSWFKWVQIFDEALSTAQGRLTEAFILLG